MAAKEVTLESLNKRVTEYAKDIRGLKRKVEVLQKDRLEANEKLRNIGAKAGEYGRRISKAEKMGGCLSRDYDKAMMALKRYSKRKHDDQLDRIEERAREADRRQLASIYRTAALTEVSWFLRRTSPEDLPRVQDGMIILFDKPDRWWLSAEKQTIAKWIELALKAKKPAEDSKAAVVDAHKVA